MESQQSGQGSTEAQKQGFGPKVTELQGRIWKEVKEAQAAAQRRAAEASPQAKGGIGALIVAAIAGLVAGILLMRRRQKPRMPWWRDPEQLRDFETWRQQLAYVMEHMPDREEMRKRAATWAERARPAAKQMRKRATKWMDRYMAM